MINCQLPAKVKKTGSVLVVAGPGVEAVRKGVSSLSV
jgi:hypothetical protein